MTTVERTSKTAVTPAGAGQDEHQPACTVGVFHDTQWPPCNNKATWEMCAHGCQGIGQDVTGYITAQICDQHAELARSLRAPMLCRMCGKPFTHWEDYFRYLRRL